ncbi:MAG TPA: HD domain-containing protein [Clostridia bacterium]|nr:HD domain-containing protein [Clostridia bacterium]
MQKKFVAELEIGQPVYNVFQVRRKELLPFKEKPGKFLSLSLGDKTGEIDAKLWDNAEDEAAGLNIADFVLVKGVVTTYNQRPQITLETVKKVNVKPADLVYFLPTSPRDVAEMWEELQQKIAQVANPHLQNLLRQVFADETLAEQFRRAPAAKSHHQAYLGGLLEHTLNVMRLAEQIAAAYEGIDRDLLLTGAVLHDIGKIYEYRYDLFIDYTDAGRLLGHIVMGANLVQDRIRSLPDFPETLKLKVLHMIVSHHGRYEWQSPKRPKFLEAAILHQADYLDAEVDKFLQAKHNYSQESWPYIRTLERYIFNE